MVAYVRRVGRALVQAFHAMSTERRIRITKRLYFQLPKLKINLTALIGEDGFSVDLSIPEVRMIFQSMKSALESNDRAQIEFSEFALTTDCRIQVDDPERITISLKGFSGFTQSVLRREDLARSLAELQSKLFSVL